MMRAERPAERPIIRPALPEDLPAMYALMAAYDMAGEFPADACYVAEVPAGLAGFARLETVAGRAYLRPIVIRQAYQGQGIGLALLEHVLGFDRDLSVIARGRAAGFYAHLGFEALDWECIPQAFWDECAACPDLKTCNPVPLQHRSAPAG